VATESITDGVIDPIGLPATVNQTYQDKNTTYDVAINDQPYYLAASNKYPYHRETATYHRTQLDMTQQPGEQTFEGWWLRSQGSWHLGSGINFLEPLQGQDVIYRMKKSVGLDPWTPGQITLLNDATQVKTLSGSVDVMGVIDNNGASCVLAYSNSNLYRVGPLSAATITNVTASSGTVTFTCTNSFSAGDIVTITGVNPVAYNLTEVTIASATGSQFTVTNAATGTYVSGGSAYVDGHSSTINYWGSGTHTANILSMTNDGYYYYVATGSGIYRGLLDGTGTGTQIYTFSATNVTIGWVKQRLIAGIDQSLYELVPAGTSFPYSLPSTANYVNKSPGWAWTGIAEGSTAIYASGYAGLNSSIIKLDLASTGSGIGQAISLTNAVTAADFPDDEHVTSIGVYLGKFVLIGTNKGVRVGTIDNSLYGGGYITYGPLTYKQTTNNHVTKFAFRDRFAWATVTNEIDGYSGLIRIDLSQQLSDGKFAWTYDLSVPVTGDTAGVAPIGETGRTAFVISGSGLYFEHPSRKVASGYFDTGAIRYNTMEKKHFKLIKMRVQEPFAGTITISSIVKDGTVSSIFTVNSANSADQDFTTNVASSQEQLAFRFTLNRDSTDKTTGPGVIGYQVKALPANKRTRTINVPLMCYDFEMDRYNVQSGYEGRAWDRINALETIDSVGNIISLQDFTTGEVVQGLIEKVTFDRESPPDKRFKGFGGIVYVQVRTI